MRITESTIRRIIREEARRALREGLDPSEIKDEVDKIMAEDDNERHLDDARHVLNRLEGFTEDTFDFSMNARELGIERGADLVDTISFDLAGSSMIPTEDLRDVLRGIVAACTSDDTGYDRNADRDADELKDYYGVPSTRRGS
jgi:hypothetical protein